MATWVCKKCGYSKDGRCKPIKCDQCGAKLEFRKDVKEEKSKN